MGQQTGTALVLVSDWQAVDRVATERNAAAHWAQEYLSWVFWTEPQPGSWHADHAEFLFRQYRSSLRWAFSAIVQQSYEANGTDAIVALMVH